MIRAAWQDAARRPGEPLRHFGTVGLFAAGVTIASLWVAARIRPVA